MQENKFKVGDKVRYTGKELPWDGKTSSPLKCGEEYTVCGLVGNSRILLAGVRSWWDVCRFEIVESSKHDKETCTVEEVNKAFRSVYPTGRVAVNVEEGIQKIKEELEKRKNPEYLKYLELKEKFG